MKKVTRLCLACACVIPWLLFAQQRSSETKPESVVGEWFRRWNALDGSDSSVQKFLELYQPNAIHQVGPSAKQIGPVFFEARDSIRKMAEDFSKANTESAFRIETVTSNE